jgi:hypothetical protein
MTRIEEIKTELKKLCDEPCGEHEVEKWNQMVAKQDELKNELRELITRDIPLSRLEEICDAERNGKSINDTLLPIPLGDLQNMKGQKIYIVPFPNAYNHQIVSPALLVPMVGYVDLEKPFAVGNNLTFWFDDYGKRWIAYIANTFFTDKGQPVNHPLAAKALAICGHSVGLHACGEDVCVRAAYMDAYLASVVLSDLLKRGYLTMYLKNDPNDKYLVTRTDYLNRLLESVELLENEEKNDDHLQ